MRSERMGHALTKIAGLLGKNGRLLNIRPLGEPAALDLLLDDTTQRVGWVSEASDYSKYDEARGVVETAVSRNQFTQLAAETFTVYTYAPTIAAIQAYLSDYWNDAWLDDRVVQHAYDLMQTATVDKQLRITEYNWIELLQVQTSDFSKKSDV